MFFVKLPQNRHPERSASQIDACHSACGAESKDPGRAYFTHAARSFSPTEARQQDLLRYALDGHEYIFSCAVTIFHPQVLASSWFSAPGKDRVGHARCGLGGWKAPNSMGKKAPSGSFGSAPQALCHAINLW